jgi:hypothetical protein
MNGWDAQLLLITGVCLGVLPILKNLPYIGKFITGQVAVIADVVVGVGAAAVRAYYFMDPFYGVPPKMWLIVAVGLIGGFLASGGYKTISDLLAKANSNNGKK